MSTNTEDKILNKARDLCQTILDLPEIQNLRREVDSFLEDEEAKSQYRLVVQKQESLHQKQHSGQSLSQEEIADFENHRKLLYDNPVAKGFLDAQQQMHKIQESVGQYVAKTFELGRLPVPEDFQSDCCGPSCGCH